MARSSKEPDLDPHTDEDEARLQQSIANDPDATELSDEHLAQMRPASEALPAEVFARLTKRGRPPSKNPKVPVTIRVSPAVLEAFKETGPGWQTRMHDALKREAVVIKKEYLITRQPLTKKKYEKEGIVLTSKTGKTGGGSYRSTLTGRMQRATPKRPTGGKKSA